MSLTAGEVNAPRADLTAQTLARFIIDTTASDIETLASDEPIFSSGIIDSMGVVQLVEYIETHTGRNVKPTDITLENFDTVDSILNFIQT